MKYRSINKVKIDPKRHDPKRSNEPKNVRNDPEMDENGIIQSASPPAPHITPPTSNLKS